MEKINGKVNFPGILLYYWLQLLPWIRRKMPHVGRAYVAFHTVNIPSVHVKNDVGGISVDDKVARN